MAQVVITLTDKPGDIIDVSVVFTPSRSDDAEETPALKLADELTHHAMRLLPVVGDPPCS